MSSGAVLGGRYRLSALLGEGGVGEVWSATHLLTGRAVAIKRLIASRHGSAPSEARARFVMEAQSACAVSHPNVVQVLDFVEPEEDAPFLVMELLEGETLAQRISRDGAMSVEETARLLLPVVSAVGTAHARGIVHRDLKPSNIFLSLSHAEHPVVKVLDFGIAKWIATHRGRCDLRTQTGSTLGTPSYMSPEQATAERGVDHRADVWSVGVILYECLSGSRPIDGENAAQMVMRLLSSGIIPIEHLVPELPQRLSEMIGRMLARDPSGRPRDLSEVFDLLLDLAGESAPRFGPPDTSVADVTGVPLPPPSELPLAVRDPEITGAPSTVTPPHAPPPIASPAPLPARGGRRWLRALASVSVASVAALIIARDRDTAEPATTAPPALAPSVAATQPVKPSIPSAPTPHSERARAVAARPGAANSAEPQALASTAETSLERARASARVARSAAPIRKAAVKSAAPRNAGLPRGADCQRSSDCESRLCLAMTCE